MEEMLWQLERRLWSGGADVYRQNLHRQCLMAFPAPTGVMGRDDVIKAIAAAPRWRDVAITAGQVVMPRDDVAVLAYQAWAKREDRTSYAATCSSTWIEEGGLWRLIQHHQTAGEV